MSITTDTLKEFATALLTQFKEINHKEWLTEEEVCEEFCITRQTFWKFRNDPLNPIPYSKFNQNQKQIYFHRNILNKYLLNNMENVTPREKKNLEKLVLNIGSAD